MRDAMRAHFEAFPDLAATRLRSVAEGELVVVHAHFVTVPGTRGDAIFDIFRVTDAHISEHWDVIAPIPATTKNTHSPL